VLTFGVAVLSVIVVVAVIGIWFTPYDLAAFGVRARLAPPSWAHPFGTDEFRRDVLSRVRAGGDLSLAIGFGGMLISLLIGVPLGLLAEFHRGFVETAMMRTVDLLISLPSVLPGLLILAVTKPSTSKTIVAPSSPCCSPPLPGPGTKASPMTVGCKKRPFPPWLTSSDSPSRFERSHTCWIAASFSPLPPPRRSPRMTPRPPPLRYCGSR
jgi:hypothetical protein